MPSISSEYHEPTQSLTITEISSKSLVSLVQLQQAKHEQNHLLSPPVNILLQDKFTSLNISPLVGSVHNNLRTVEVYQRRYNL